MDDSTKTLLGITTRYYSTQLVAGTSGNMSDYLRDQNLILITPSSIEDRSMTLDDIVVMTLNGNVLTEQHSPSSTWRIHTNIYHHHTDINILCGYTTTFSICHQSIPVILIEMVPYLGRDVPVATFDISGSETLEVDCLAVLNNHKTCLISSHGTRCIGNDLPHSYETAMNLTDAAKTYQFAAVIGTPQHLSAENINKMRG